MIILALDTCMAACSAAVVADGQVLAALSEPMMRGHQERLALMAQEVLAGAGVKPKDIGRVAVTIGPGSFTGLRVGVAFAKGFAAALGIPCVGVGSLEALAACAPQTGGPMVAVIDANRGQVYAQTVPGGPPEQMTREAAAEVWSRLEAPTFIGPGAELAVTLAGRGTAIALVAPDPVAIARLGAAMTPGPFKPLYLRAPDAKPTVVT